MNTAEELKEIIRQKYDKVALQGKAKDIEVGCGFGSANCNGLTKNNTSYTILMNNKYESLNGYVAGADLGLGCGLPTQFAKIKQGDTVVDLGSGSGNDCFIARAETGELGRVIGLDITQSMIDRSRKTAQDLSYLNVEFVCGDIEDIPMPNDLANVVISNCTMNLVPNKEKAFAETFRILKSGGHFCISDVMLVGELPNGLQRDAELYAGCVSGVIQEEAYLAMVAKVGFVNIQVQKKGKISLPTGILLNYLTADELAIYRQSARGIYSITLFAQKASS